MPSISELEKHQLPCFIPVLIAIGILLNSYYNYSNYFILLPLAFILFLNYSRITIAICFILIGIFCYKLRQETVNTPIIALDKQFHNITAKIDNITPLEDGHRMSLSSVRIKNIPLKKTPIKIRIKAKTSSKKLKIDDVVKFQAILSKPMQPYLPDSYNFARDCYFKKIGAVGYSVSDFKVVSTHNQNFFSKVNNIRNNIQTRVNNVLGSYYGSIATALMINEYNNIDKNILKDLRITGLAHILSVSGMHLSLVMAIFFFSSRIIINSLPYFPLRINSKKYAAFISLIGSGFYLLISGMEVAAVRSFVMTSIIILSIILDQTNSPMRALSFAAIIILISTPENIFHPSFQMSFAAVLALIACYEKFKFSFAKYSFIQHIIFYILSLCLASLTAGLATLPFAIYHFGLSANYSMLANLLAVPITSFWLMPLVVVSFILYPFHLESLSLNLMKYGIKLIIEIANKIASLPQSSTAFMKITDINLLLISAGMVILCLLLTKLRYIGIALILIALTLQASKKRPDIFIDYEDKIAAFIDENNKLIFITKTLSPFKKQLLLNQLGLTDHAIVNNNHSKLIDCDKEFCYFNKSHYSVILNKIDLTMLIYKNSQLIKIISRSSKTKLISLNNFSD